MLHFTCALLAAAITLSVATMLSVVWFLVVLFLGGWWPPDPEMFKGLMASMPLRVGAFGILLVLVGVLMLVPWRMPVFRGGFRRSWVAGVLGALLGMSVSPLWSISTQLIVETAGSSWRAYVNELPAYLTFSALGGGLSCFLHAFFVNRALAKRAWLAARREELSAERGV